MKNQIEEIETLHNFIFFLKSENKKLRKPQKCLNKDQYEQKIIISNSSNPIKNIGLFMNSDIIKHSWNSFTKLEISCSSIQIKFNRIITDFSQKMNGIIIVEEEISNFSQNQINFDNFKLKSSEGKKNNLNPYFKKK